MNLEELTLEEVDIIETKGRASISSLDDDTTPKARVMAAIVYVIKKREDPQYRFEDALKVPMKEASSYLGKGQEDQAKQNLD